MLVNLPTTFDESTIAHLMEQLDACRDIDDVTIDFGLLRYSKPIAMLVAGSKLRDWRQYRIEHGYRSWQKGISASISAHSYLMHLGFFNFVHIEEGNQVGQALGSKQYLPITRIVRPIVDPVLDGVEQWYDTIESEARRLGGVLAGSHDDSEELRTYTYCIREVIRNVFEHARVDECYICGQRWANGTVEIAIIDEGVGLYATLAGTHNVEGDGGALALAVRPGISRISTQSPVPNLYDNSGFGLFILTQLAGSFGWFVLGSGTAMTIGHGQDRSCVPCSFAGTYFGMRLNSAPKDFGSVLADIIASGEEEARTFGISRRASGRTRLVGTW